VHAPPFASGRMFSGTIASILPALGLAGLWHTAQQQLVGAAVAAGECKGHRPLPAFDRQQLPNKARIYMKTLPATTVVQVDPT
jgi:hypothetical protein